MFGDIKYEIISLLETVCHKFNYFFKYFKTG